VEKQRDLLIEENKRGCELLKRKQSEIEQLRGEKGMLAERLLALDELRASSTSLTAATLTRAPGSGSKKKITAAASIHRKKSPSAFNGSSNLNSAEAAFTNTNTAAPTSTSAFK
jgi:hypothetical protein